MKHQEEDPTPLPGENVIDYEYRMGHRPGVPSNGGAYNNRHSNQWWKVLAKLRTDGPLPLNESVGPKSWVSRLAVDCNVTRAAIYGYFRSLRQNGYAENRDGKIHITAAGRQMLRDRKK